MKKVLLIFILLPFLSYAQNTWVQKLSYNSISGGYYDSIAGIKKAEVGSDGSLYVLAFMGNHGNQNIFKFSPNSHHYEWDILAGTNGMQVDQWVDQFKATSDSGIIVCHNVFDELTNSTYGYLEKYSHTGALEWSHQFGNWGDTQNVFDVIEKNSGGYFALIEDSIYTLDYSGNVIDSSGFVSGKKFLEMVNGDLLVLTQGNQLVRTDTLGNIFWSHSCSGYFAYDSTSVFILNSISSIQKVDALSGTQMWNRNYGYTPFSEIEATHDGGFIASIGFKPFKANGFLGSRMPGVLLRVDSIGDTLWTRTFPFPLYGLSTVKIMPNGNLCSGGGYLSGFAIAGYTYEHSAFCCMMNGDASYPLQQIGYTGPLDANHDQIADFADDALEVMLGLGLTGPSRDTTIYGQIGLCEEDDIAIDWSTYTISGVNRKYSDYDGNGIIDTNDIQICDVWGNGDSITLAYRFQNPNTTQNIEEFCLIPLMDTIAPGEPIYYFMVMGSNANPVDSIYGFAFSYLMDSFGNDFSDSVFIYPTSLGTSGVDLFFKHRSLLGFDTDNGLEYRTRTLLCRTDFQNAHNINDTIGIIRFITIPVPHTVTPSIRRFKAILSDGSEIPFNTCMGNIFIDSSLLSLPEKEKIILKVYPNPVSDMLTVNTTVRDITSFEIMNAQGQNVESIRGIGSILINVKDYPEGIFLIKTVSNEGITSIPFIVNH